MATGVTECETEHEYVEYMLDVKDGQVVGCEFFGEGRQVEPLTEPMLLKLLEGDSFPRGWRRIERRIKLAFGKLMRRVDGEEPKR